MDPRIVDALARMKVPPSITKPVHGTEVKVQIRPKESGPRLSDSPHHLLTDGFGYRDDHRSHDRPSLVLGTNQATWAIHVQLIKSADERRPGLHARIRQVWRLDGHDGFADALAQIIYRDPYANADYAFAADTIDTARRWFTERYRLTDDGLNYYPRYQLGHERYERLPDWGREHLALERLIVRYPALLAVFRQHPDLLAATESVEAATDYIQRYFHLEPTQFAGRVNFTTRDFGHPTNRVLILEDLAMGRWREDLALLQVVHGSALGRAVRSSPALEPALRS